MHSSVEIKKVHMHMIQLCRLTSFQGSQIAGKPFSYYKGCLGPFKYYVITFLTFLGPPIHLFDD